MTSFKRLFGTSVAYLALVAAFLAAGEESFVAARADEPPAGTHAAKRSRYKRSRLTTDETEMTADHRTMLLTTGEDRAVDLDFDVNGGANGISVGNPTVLAPTLVKIGDKRQIVFKPLKAGETTVTLRDADGTLRLIFNVRVTGSNLLRVAGEIRSLLRDIEGIDIRIVGPKVVIDGEVLVPSDYGRLFTVTTDKAYAEYILNLATLSPLAMQVLAKRIQDDIQTFAPNAHTRVVNGMIFLEGQVDSQAHAKKAFDIALLYLPEVRPESLLDRDQNAQHIAGRQLVQQFLVVNPAPPKKEVKLVRITVHFVELDKDYEKVFGFKWQPGFSADPQITVGQGGTGGVGASGASFSATISSLIPHLSSLQEAGFARILKTGTIVVKSGQPANLAEQEELPFALAGPVPGSVAPSSAKVGIELAITPKILGQSEDIEMDVKLSQSSVVGRTPAGQAPTTSNHKVETKLYVKSNESAALAGVTSADVSTDFNKDDPASNLVPQDPLFTLMHTKNFQKKKSQFVVFVTPQIIENASEGTDDLKKNFRVKVK